MSSLAPYNMRNAKGAGADSLIDKLLGADIVATVREIPPRKKKPTLKKVATYCRVSTKNQDQLDSLTTQE